MRKLTRRQAVLGALVSAAVPPQAMSEADPHAAWLSEWTVLSERYGAFPDDGLDAEADALYDRMCDIVDLAKDTPATTVTGLNAKLELFRASHCRFVDCFVDPAAANSIIDEVIDFVGRA